MLRLKNQRKHDTYLSIDRYHASAIMDLKRGWTGIAVTPTGKASFVHSHVQTRHMGQYIGKKTL